MRSEIENNWEKGLGKAGWTTITGQFLSSQNIQDPEMQGSVVC